MVVNKYVVIYVGEICWCYLVVCDYILLVEVSIVKGFFNWGLKKFVFYVMGYFRESV